jgi:hypothetical protein
MPQHWEWMWPIKVWCNCSMKSNFGSYCERHKLYCTKRCVVNGAASANKFSLSPVQWRQQLLRFLEGIHLCVQEFKWALEDKKRFTWQRRKFEERELRQIAIGIEGNGEALKIIHGIKFACTMITSSMRFYVKKRTAQNCFARDRVQNKSPV